MKRVFVFGITNSCLFAIENNAISHFLFALFSPFEKELLFYFFSSLLVYIFSTLRLHFLAVNKHNSVLIPGWRLVRFSNWRGSERADGRALRTDSAAATSTAERLVFKKFQKVNILNSKILYQQNFEYICNLFYNNLNN